MEVASTRKYLAVYRCYVCTLAHFDRLGTDGEREYHEFYQGQPGLQSPASRE